MVRMKIKIFILFVFLHYGHGSENISLNLDDVIENVVVGRLKQWSNGSQLVMSEILKPCIYPLVRKNLSLTYNDYPYEFKNLLGNLCLYQEDLRKCFISAIDIPESEIKKNPDYRATEAIFRILCSSRNKIAEIGNSAAFSDCFLKIRKSIGDCYTKLYLAVRHDDHVSCSSLEDFVQCASDCIDGCTGLSKHRLSLYLKEKMTIGVYCDKDEPMIPSLEDLDEDSKSTIEDKVKKTDIWTAASVVQEVKRVHDKICLSENRIDGDDLKSRFDRAVKCFVDGKWNTWNISNLDEVSTGYCRSREAIMNCSFLMLESFKPCLMNSSYSIMKSLVNLGDDVLHSFCNDTNNKNELETLNTNREYLNKHKEGIYKCFQNLWKYICSLEGRNLTEPSSGENLKKIRNFVNCINNLLNRSNNLDWLLSIEKINIQIRKLIKFERIPPTEDFQDEKFSLGEDTCEDKCRKSVHSLKQKLVEAGEELKALLQKQGIERSSLTGSLKTYVLDSTNNEVEDLIETCCYGSEEDANPKQQDAFMNYLRGDLKECFVAPAMEYGLLNKSRSLFDIEAFLGAVCSGEIGKCPNPIWDQEDTRLSLPKKKLLETLLETSTSFTKTACSPDVFHWVEKNGKKLNKCVVENWEDFGNKLLKAINEYLNVQYKLYRDFVRADGLNGQCVSLETPSTILQTHYCPILKSFLDSMVDLVLHCADQEEQNFLYEFRNSLYSQPGCLLTMHK